MNLFTKLLMFPVARRKVECNTLSDFASILMADLEAGKIRNRKVFPPALVERLVQEAYQRAIERDSDGIARYGLMYKEIEEISRGVVKILNGDPDCDGRLKSILAHQGM